MLSGVIHYVCDSVHRGNFFSQQRTPLIHQSVRSWVTLCEKWTLNKLVTINGKNTRAFDNVGKCVKVKREITRKLAII